MASIFAKRIGQLARVDTELVERGAAVSVWVSEDLHEQLTQLASELGISRSSVARELLGIAVPQALQDAMDQTKQLALMPLSDREGKDALEAFVGGIRPRKPQPGRRSKKRRSSRK